ncbi:MAG TPA: hypothetical protein VJJ24_03415 [Candidatus Paceibacterota bacterium]
MAILEYNEVKPGVVIVLEGDPYECLSAHVFRKQQRKPVNATKLRNLKTGSVKEHSFGSSDKVAEAELESRPVKYLYFNKGEYWFCEVNDPSKRFQLDSEMLGDKMKFIKPNSTIDTISFPAQSGSASGGNDEIIGVKVPIKVELKVTEAPPDMRGNTAQGGSKQVTLESGAVINVPMFVKEGDVIRINTETGDYVERA